MRKAEGRAAGREEGGAKDGSAKRRGKREGGAAGCGRPGAPEHYPATGGRATGRNVP
jgi:hypothetical protein